MRKNSQVADPVPLNDEESTFVANATSSIEDLKLRECIQKAMTADLEWKKGENRMRSTENTK